MRKLTRVLFAFVATVVMALSVVGCSAKAKLERHLKQADHSFDSGDYQTAEVEYLNVLQASPLHPHAIGRLGTMYFEQGRIDRAFPYLAKASELATNDVELHFLVGNLNLAVGRHSEAREKGLLVLAANPRHAEAPLLLAEASLSPKDIQETRAHLKKITAQSGATAPVQVALGILFLRERNVQAAEESIQAALKLDPKFAAAHQAIGSIYAARNELKQAQAAFKLAAELSKPRSPRRIGYADFLFAIGQVDEGKRLYAEITKNTPDYLPAWIKMADRALSEKEYEECLASINQVLARDSTNIEALILRGRLFLTQGQTEKAIADLERTSNQFNGRSPQAHYYSALAHLQNDDSIKAFKSVNQAVALHTNYADANILLARLSIGRGESAAVVPLLNRLVAQAPQNAQAHLLLADAYLNQKKPEEAVAVLQNMQNLFPKNHQVPFVLGNALIANGKMAQARAAFEKSHGMAPDFYPALERLVDLDVNDEKYTRASDRVQMQIEKFPSAAESWMLLAKIHLAQKQMDQAETTLLKAIELNPNLRNPYLLLSQVYLNLDQKQRALEKLTKLVVTSTNDVAAYMQIGMIHDSMTNHPAARDAYEKLLVINPRFSPALNNLAYLYSEHLNDLDRAYEMAERARQQSPADPYSADTLGWVLYKRGEFSRALGLLLESASRLSSVAEIQYHLGMTHYMIGNIEPARSALNLALQDKKDFPGKAKIPRHLAILDIDLKTANSSTLKELEKSLQEQPADPVVLGLVAAIYERDGANDKAAKTYQQVLSVHPRNFEAMLGLSRLYAGPLNQPEKALELAKSARDLAPEDGRISHLLGRLIYDTGDYKWALSLIQEASRRLAPNPELLYDHAWAAYNVGQVEESVSKMQEVVQTGNSFAKIEKAKRFLALVDALKNPGEAGSLTVQIQQALKEDSNDIPALMLSARIQEQQRNFAEAKRVYKKILSANSNFVPAVRNLAILHAEDSEENQDAYDLAARARAAFPDDVAVARALGILAYRKGDYSRSAQLLRESVNRQPDPASAFYLGMAQYHLKDRVASKASLRRALDLNLPENLASDAKKILAELK